ncbi:hypothetical protein [Polaromonas sp. CG_23.6]|uniref:DUF6900 domain-containing protein n=1 Tax=Polaromonas sp. CG_23.6 TaxID=2760709 RepID=UPI0024761977|nr:hypothetical protein [Polaromonas sp. CG_23.6]MDH6185282.1 putative NACHT family NTPase [Polaromonas sp. CG_23.6]
MQTQITADQTAQALSACLSKIALEKLGVMNLVTRNSDGEDFYELAVWSIEKALHAAYVAGRQSVQG